MSASSATRSNTAKVSLLPRVAIAFLISEQIKGYYVLSASGYLHERKSSSTEKVNAISPVFSLFLPECSLGYHAKESDKSHKWHCEGNKAIKSTFEGKVKSSLRFGGKEIAYTFRARTHSEMTGWWEEMDKLSRDTKPQPAHSTVGNAHANRVSVAVANVGYAAPAPPSIVATSAVAPTAVSERSTPIADAHTSQSIVVVEHESMHSREVRTESEDSDEEGGSSAEEDRKSVV